MGLVGFMRYDILSRVAVDRLFLCRLRTTMNGGLRTQELCGSKMILRRLASGRGVEYRWRS
jgi:hypothetical protein